MPRPREPRSALRRMLDAIMRPDAPPHPRRTSTPAIHRKHCERAIEILEHASNALGKEPANAALFPLHASLDGRIDTAAARMILSESIAAVAGEIRLRIVALEAVRQAGFAALAARPPAPAAISQAPPGIGSTPAALLGLIAMLPHIAP